MGFPTPVGLLGWVFRYGQVNPEAGMCFLGCLFVCFSFGLHGKVT